MAEQHQSTEMQHQSARRSKKSISPSAFFITIALTIAIGFMAGMYRTHLLATVAPLLGMKVSADTLDLSSVQKTYQALKANFDGDLDNQALIDGANAGLVNAAGDRFTVFMTAKEKSQFDDDLSGTIGGGIGAELGIRNDVVTVVRVLKDNPAIEAGIAAGDVITKINDQTTKGWTVAKAVEQIRGEVGTTLKIEIQRGNETKEFTLTRALVSNPSVTSTVVDGVGTITIGRFDQETSNLARAAATDLKKQGVKAIVLDLRDNGGGYLTAAQDVAGLWLRDKVVVTEKTNGKVTEELRSGSNPILAGIPTVVLVNGNSASASEIVAGALQDNGAAKLVGTKTYGKGSVQALVSLPDGAQLKVTVARWYTPKGKNINEEGIAPDVTSERTQQDINQGLDPQLDAAKQELGV